VIISKIIEYASFNRGVAPKPTTKNATTNTGTNADNSLAKLNKTLVNTVNKIEKAS
jgi:hypothetical protein